MEIRNKKNKKSNEKKTFGLPKSTVWNIITNKESTGELSNWGGY